MDMILTLFSRRAPAALALACLLTLAFVSAGCQGTRGGFAQAEDMIPPTLALSPGDVLEVIFPGATNLNGLHRIGPEGTITMPLVGPVQASGTTTEGLQARLLELYEPELKDKTVIVSLAGSANAVYVTGAVLRPGKIALERPLTALEAIMEVGGFQEVANRRRVTVIRYQGNDNVKIDLDLEPVLTGEPVPPFYVRPRDIVHVHTRVQWF